MEKKHVVFVGATSAIAIETARIYARQGAKITLVARDAEKLEATGKDLLARGASDIHVCITDFNCQQIDDEVLQQIQFPVDILIVAHGILGDQAKLLKSAEARTELMQTNFLSVMDLLSRLIEPFNQQGSGSIAVISSVAGDRGRQSNFYYGASKAALTAFSSGLRNALFAKGVHVMTVLPGFVATPMTAHLPQGPLFVSPKKIAKDLVHGLQRKKDVLYTPIFWRFIMLAIKSIPEALFKRLQL
ncbi:MAG: SDR family oxidoreductase [Oligoflexus sp.]